MGIRFRKRIKIAKGLTINLSNGGVSTTIGQPGASVNVGGKKGPTATIGIPGSGLSYSKKLGSGNAKGRAQLDVPSNHPEQWDAQGRSQDVDIPRIIVGLLLVIAFLAWLIR